MKFLIVFLLGGCAHVYKAADDLETAAIVVKEGIERAEEEKEAKKERRRRRRVEVPRADRPVRPRKRIKKTKTCVTVESGWIWKSKRQVCE